MKSIHSLIPDIYKLVQRKDGWYDTVAEQLSSDLTKSLKDKFGVNARKPSLRLSQMGARCPCALWYSIHYPERAESLPPWAEVKYTFGLMVEALALTLARAAGHHVVGEQDELELDGIVGHRDCIIDGCTVDVKSASSIAFQKFKDANFEKMDTFGYLDQLDGYVMASSNDPLVLVKDKGYILAVDKQLGHMYLHEHDVTSERTDTLTRRIVEFKRIVGYSSPPSCTCKTQPEGASGNIRLSVKASYSPYKHCCFPNLRTFIYANGPVYLTKVVRRPEPHIKEIDREGKVVYNA